jgi:hypothetical protein
LFNEETVREESRRRYIREQDSIHVEQFPVVELTPPCKIDLPELPF